VASETLGKHPYPISVARRCAPGDIDRRNIVELELESLDVEPYKAPTSPVCEIASLMVEHFLRRSHSPRIELYTGLNDLTQSTSEKSPLVSVAEALSRVVSNTRRGLSRQHGTCSMTAR
jgi:hypothetical protein